MNYKFTGYLLGVVALCEGALLLIPFILALCVGESTALALGITAGIAVAIGIPLVLLKPKDASMKTRGGLVSVALCWIMMSLIGCLPLIISGKVPNFVDALFETVSGFTSTGSSIVADLDALGLALNMWRALTQWIGGMGILLFVIALLPKTNGVAMQVFKAETPGPKAGKLVSKLSLTARILYLIYFVLTVACAIMLICGGVPVYDSFVLAFATASTGGFTSSNAGIAAYSNLLYVESVITVFMFLFAINFTLHYFVIIGKVREAVKSEEVRWFAGIILGATVVITLSLFFSHVYEDFWTCLRYSLFQSVSVITTTGFVFADTSQWPAFAQVVILLLMFVGGCAGSTAGGLKVSRIMILTKSGMRELSASLNPRRVVNIHLEGRVVEKDTVHSTLRYFLVYIMVFIFSFLLVVIDNFGVTPQATFVDGFSAVATSLNNVGPALFDYASGNFADFTALSKCVLIFDMLAGRLEILPLLMLFNYRSWQ
ncbi:MAG: TrkH family potassium uptake protein [Corallococcus sp.]|nr:TrkH family potassium uptake protein [Corallococcus sp.]